MDKERLLKRLNRVEGQIRGISRMVAADKPYVAILTQISAAQAALDKSALDLLRGPLHTISSSEAGELLKAFQLYIKR